MNWWTIWPAIPWRVTRFRARAVSGSFVSEPRGRGKRGGARVIYFYGGERTPVYALLAYAKSAKTDLSPAERRAVAALAAAVKAAGKEET